VSGLRRLCQITVTAALAGGTAGAQALAGCPAAAVEALLEAEPADRAADFALTRQLCGARLVRTPTVAQLPEPVVAIAAPGSAATAVTPATPAIDASARVVPVRPATPRPRDSAGAARVQALAPLMAEVARRHDIDPLLLHAVAHIESRHQSQAVSHAGARGLMQVMPATGRRMGIAEAERALLSPQANLEASARYLKLLQARFGNDLRLVLAGYNAGEGAVERHGRRVPPFAETQAYVRNVLAVYGELRRHFGGGGA
jgi:soluble lytic murein transglycosylase-like protein